MNHAPTHRLRIGSQLCCDRTGRRGEIASIGRKVIACRDANGRRFYIWHQDAVTVHQLVGRENVKYLRKA